MTEEVRGLDIPALSEWLTRNIDGVSAPFSFRILAGGHSNLTYQVTDANGRRFALRRPPLGTVSARAHDMSREYKIYSALQATAVPVPGTVVMCEDTQVIGAPFYLMDFVAGAVIDSPEEVQNHLPDPAQRREAAFSLIDTLATMHRLDVDRIGLGDLGRRENYLERQLKRFKGIWDKTKTRDLDAIDRQYEQLMDLQPEQRYTGIVHSDYRLGNVMLDEHGRVAAVLDWELCALGDVLVDVGFLIDNWDDNKDPAPGVWMQAAPTRAGGFPTQQELIDRYAERSGFDVSDLDYYRAFCYWRIAIIGEGIKRRYQSAALGSEISPEFVEERIRQRVAATDHFLGRVPA